MSSLDSNAHPEPGETPVLSHTPEAALSECHRSPRAVNGRDPRYTRSDSGEICRQTQPGGDRALPSFSPPMQCGVARRHHHPLSPLMPRPRDPEEGSSVTSKTNLAASQQRGSDNGGGSREGGESGITTREGEEARKAVNTGPGSQASLHRLSSPPSPEVLPSLRRRWRCGSSGSSQCHTAEGSAGEDGESIRVLSISPSPPPPLAPPPPRATMGGNSISVRGDGNGYRGYAHGSVSTASLAGEIRSGWEREWPTPLQLDVTPAAPEQRRRQQKYQPLPHGEEGQQAMAETHPAHAPHQRPSAHSPSTPRAPPLSAPHNGDSTSPSLLAAALTSEVAALPASAVDTHVQPAPPPASDHPYYATSPPAAAPATPATAGSGGGGAFASKPFANDCDECERHEENSTASGLGGPAVVSLVDRYLPLSTASISPSAFDHSPFLGSPAAAVTTATVARSPCSGHPAGSPCAASPISQTHAFCATRRESGRSEDGGHASEIFDFLCNVDTVGPTAAQQHRPLTMQSSGGIATPPPPPPQPQPSRVDTTPTAPFHPTSTRSNFSPSPGSANGSTAAVAASVSMDELMYLSPTRRAPPHTPRATANRSTAPRHTSIFYPHGMEKVAPIQLHYLQLGNWRTVAGGHDYFAHRRLERGEVVGHSVRWLHNARPRGRFVFLVDPVEAVVPGGPDKEAEGEGDEKKRDSTGGSLVRLQGRALVKWWREFAERVLGTAPAFAYNKGRLVKQPSLPLPSSGVEGTASGEPGSSGSEERGRPGAMEGRAAGTVDGCQHDSSGSGHRRRLARSVSVGAFSPPAAPQTPNTHFVSAVLPLSPTAAVLSPATALEPPMPSADTAVHVHGLNRLQLPASRALPSSQQASPTRHHSPYNSPCASSPTNAAGCRCNDTGRRSIASVARAKRKRCVEAIEIAHDDVTALDYNPRITSSRLSIEARAVYTFTFDSLKEALAYYGCPEALDLMREQYNAGQSSYIPQSRHRQHAPQSRNKGDGEEDDERGGGGPSTINADSAIAPGLSGPDTANSRARRGRVHNQSRRNSEEAVASPLVVGYAAAASATASPLSLREDLLGQHQRQQQYRQPEQQQQRQWMSLACPHHCPSPPRLSSSHFDTVVSVFTADPDFNAVLREMLLPDPPGTHPYTETTASQLRLLALYEAGMPSWAVFLASTILPYRRSLRLLYVGLVNLWPLVSLFVGVYDLYKHLPQLTKFLSRTLEPLSRWVDERVTVRLSFFVTYLVSVAVTIFASLTSFLSRFLAVQLFSWPLVRLLCQAIQMPFLLAIETVWAVGSIAYSFLWLLYMTVKVLVIGPFLLVTRLAGVMQVRSAVAAGAPAAAAVEGGASLTLRWWRAWREFWVTVASPTKNLAKAWWDSVVHVCSSAARREASIRRWYAPKLQTLLGVVHDTMDILLVNASIALDLLWRQGYGQLLVQAAVIAYLYWLVFCLSQVMVGELMQGLAVSVWQWWDRTNGSLHGDTPRPPSPTDNDTVSAHVSALSALSLGEPPSWLSLLSLCATPHHLRECVRAAVAALVPLSLTGEEGGGVASALALRSAWVRRLLARALFAPPAPEDEGAMGRRDGPFVEVDLAAEEAASQRDAEAGPFSDLVASKSYTADELASLQLSIIVDSPPTSLRPLWEVMFLSAGDWLRYDAEELTYYTQCGMVDGKAGTMAMSLPDRGFLRHPHRTTAMVITVSHSAPASIQ